MVVVDLGRSLAVVGAEDAAGVLDKPSLPGDGCGEEEGVQRGAVEPFPAYGPVATASRGGPPGWGWSRASAAARALAPMPPRRMTGQDDGVVAYRAQRVGELVQVRGPVSEDEAVPALGQRSRHVGDDLSGPLLVCDQAPLVNEGDAARRGRAGISGVAVPGRVEAEYRSRASASGAVPGSIGVPLAGSRGPVMVRRTRPTCMVMRSSSLSRRYGVAVRPSQRPYRDLPDCILEGGSWHVAALVGDD